ncbi:hypothetical protein BJ085DRAFT_40407 [Dimargaris cristalligena]|uniref:G-protein coupled receptors family 1 profile domain-containing protein n=1 Tax=Dimargaris cristalligena TaxID=215637 RepID=A0A4P9ZMI6_9FUNG|nr:hypothetical protein BJ085DRAFT_40407 [Dimargaris cristalligena]|eukprot:RKP34335.1 hypothetical protein BJ085DRAFT_40407 [Dimargaris cristalligena]
MSMLDLYVAIYVLDGLSIVCSMASIIIVLWVWYKQPSSKESPSFNLTLWIGLSDFPQRISDILTNPLTFMGNYPSGPAFAKWLMWFSFFASYWFIYLNAMITLDLQLVFFHRLPRQARIRRWYPLIGSGIAFFLAFWYLLLPDVRLTPEGVIMTGTEGSFASRFLIVWTNMWMHIGIIYALGVVIAVCFKVFRSQSHLRRFDQGEHAKAMSKALVRNTRLIIAYPIILFIVYVPYVLASWFASYFPGPFSMYWNVASNVVYASQGIFSFIILLFHPVMLSTYRQNNFGFSSLWSRVSRRLGSNSGTYQSSMANSQATPGPSGQSYSLGQVHSGGNPSSVPHLRTMDMGPGVTGYFGGALLKGLEGMEAIEAQTDIVEKDQLFPLLDDPTCL